MTSDYVAIAALHKESVQPHSSLKRSIPPLDLSIAPKRLKNIEFIELDSDDELEPSSFKAKAKPLPIPIVLVSPSSPLKIMSPFSSHRQVNPSFPPPIPVPLATNEETINLDDSAPICLSISDTEEHISDFDDEIIDIMSNISSPISPSSSTMEENFSSSLIKQVKLSDTSDSSVVSHPPPFSPISRIDDPFATMTSRWKLLSPPPRWSITPFFTLLSRDVEALTPEDFAASAVAVKYDMIRRYRYKVWGMSSSELLHYLDLIEDMIVEVDELMEEVDGTSSSEEEEMEDDETETEEEGNEQEEEEEVEELEDEDSDVELVTDNANSEDQSNDPIDEDPDDRDDEALLDLQDKLHELQDIFERELAQRRRMTARAISEENINWQIYLDTHDRSDLASQFKMRSDRQLSELPGQDIKVYDSEEDSGADTQVVINRQANEKQKSGPDSSKNGALALGEMDKWITFKTKLDTLCDVCHFDDSSWKTTTDSLEANRSFANHPLLF